MTQCCTCDRF